MAGAERPRAALPLRIRGLRVDYGAARPAVAGADLEIAPGEVVGVIGESGSGKSTLAYAVTAHLPGARTTGTIEVAGQKVGSMGSARLRRFRGGEVGFVHQNPRDSLNPGMRVGKQLAEQLRLHTQLSTEAVSERVRHLLEQMRFPDPEDVARRYPHELSGGQQQRIGIAMALSCDPDLVIMDEPTTGLDVTTEAHIVELIRQIRRERDVAILFISHDLALVGSLADRVVVMRHGEVVEEGGVTRVLREPRHPYTSHLVGEVRRTAARRPAGREDDQVEGPRPVIKAEDLVKTYGTTRALDGVSAQVVPGRTLAIVGESGSGKTTLARCFVGLTAPDKGRVVIGGTEAATRLRGRPRSVRRSVQMVFQNPDSSLNPWYSIGATLSRPLIQEGGMTRSQRRRRVAELMDQVKLPLSYLGRRPHELSGGEKQRVAVARAFAVRPVAVLLDEPTSALDASVQGALLDLLDSMQKAHEVAYVLISHDFAAVRALADDVMVMRGGRVLERGPSETILDSPKHTYTRELLDATLILDDVISSRSAA